MGIKEQIISVISYNLQGLFVKHKEVEEWLIRKLADRISQVYEERNADLILVNLQETYELTK